MNSKQVIMIVVVIFVLSMGVYFLIRPNKDGFKPNNWKIEYLKKVYPLGTNLTEKQFDCLEFFYTDILPQHYLDLLKPNVYRSAIPGPSCGELPCGCTDGVPDVSFEPDPLLRKGWPPCNAPDPYSSCCDTVDTYKQCMREGKIKWPGGSDTWSGPSLAQLQTPPKYGDVWKPSLWPKFTVAINKFPADDWESFYHRQGYPDNTWIEGVHSAFLPSITTYGVWFYRTIGSGIFVNLGKTVRGRNKLDVLRQLGWTAEDIVDFIMRPDKGTVMSDAKVTPMTTGLGGPESVGIWLAGQYEITLADLIKGTGLSILEIVETAMSPKNNNYNISRLATCGAFDNPAFYMAQKQGYNSIQYTVQPNLYTGYTTEIMIVGGCNKAVYTSVADMPENIYRVLDPNNLPDGPSESEGEACEYDFPLTCAYCKQVPATTTAKMGCLVPITDVKPCPSDPHKSPY